MKTLYLLRHAHTLSAPDDYERILSPRGVEEAQKIGKFMRERGLLPERVLSSSSVRTTQTARLVLGTLFEGGGDGADSRSERGLYQASAQKILGEIQNTDDSIRKLMLVCHNPGVSELAAMLDKAGNPRRFESVAPGTLAVFRAECRSWRDFSPETASLELVFAP